MSVERLKGKEYSYNADVYSVGMTLWAFAVGKHRMNGEIVNSSFFLS